MTAASDDPLADVRAWDASSTRLATPCGSGSMVWRSWGDGPAVVLLHGGAGSWRHWIRTLPALACRYRVLAPDSPGLGESARPDGEWTAEASAAIVSSGLRSILRPGETCRLVGFSAGAMLAGLVAGLVGPLCETLVLVGAGGLGTRRHPVVLEKVRGKQGAALRDAHVENLARLMIADRARIDAQAIAIQAWNSDHTRISSVGVAQSDILARALDGLDTRVAAIWGAQDAVARNALDERLEAVRARHPLADIRVIPGAGHWVAYEAAETFNPILLDMLAGPVPAATHRGVLQ